VNDINPYKENCPNARPADSAGALARGIEVTPSAIELVACAILEFSREAYDETEYARDVILRLNKLNSHGLPLTSDSIPP
jgi:hypothetical protein